MPASGLHRGGHGVIRSVGLRCPGFAIIAESGRRGLGGDSATVITSQLLVSSLGGAVFALRLGRLNRRRECRLMCSTPDKIRFAGNVGFQT